MDSLTAKERQVVEELKKRTIDDVTPKMLEDDFIFYRFSKARNFNVEEAEIMLRNHISWIKEINYDTILTDYKPPEVLLKYLPTNFICFDKEGRIVRLMDIGRTDYNGICSAVTKRDLEKYSLFLAAQDITRLWKRGGNLGKPIYSAIIDLENASYRSAISSKNSISYLFYLIKSFLLNSPEILGTATVINAPSYFSTFYALVRPILPSSIIQKVRIYGADSWKEVLLKEINPDDLPAYLGGNRTDPDGNPLCKTFILQGQPVPKRYYTQTK